jgi:hypothetical protein
VAKKDYYVENETGPSEINNLPVVPSTFYKHFPGGQLKIREAAALLAIENGVSNTWAEFGVAEGHSAYFLSQYLLKDMRFFLFDSFEGLPEDWVHNQESTSPKGKFACRVPKFNDDRLVIIPGWFENTLPCAHMTGPLGLIHIDSDVYSSCKTVLERLDDQIVPGTVILFDELWGYENWREGEYKALIEWHRDYKFVVRDTKFRVIIECA